MSLERFHRGQGFGPDSEYENALAELRSGRKRGHWIWFVMPQLRGLGKSAISEQYGIADMNEAKAYLMDDVLRARLEQIINIISEQTALPGQSLTALMGGELDALKAISCLTLFAAAGMPEASILLERLGAHCIATQNMLASH